MINTRAEKAISTRYLSEDERVAIADLRRTGMGVRAIARELGRSPSTISRELRRNRDVRGQYRPFTAQRMAAQRRSRPGRGKIIADPTLQGMVAGLLGQRWSPEQVARAVRDAFPTEPDRHLTTSWADWAASCPRRCALVGVVAARDATRRLAATTP